jgi:hypothetical protein
MTESMLKNNKKSMKMPKGAIRIRKSKKDRYSNCQKDKDKEKMPSKNLQNTSQKTKDRAMLSPIQSRMNSDTQEG